LTPAESAPSAPAEQLPGEIQTVEIAISEAPEPSHPIDPPIESSRLATARQPNAYESLVFLAAQRRKPAASPKQIDRWTAEAIARLIADPATDPVTVAAPLMMERPSAEARLIALARQSHGEEQFAAIRLLARVGTQRSVPILVKLSELPATHAAAIHSLAVLADPAALGNFIAAEQNPALRQELLAALLQRGDAPSMAVWLSFVEADGPAPPSSAMAGDLSPQAIETLLELVQASRPSQRLAAARVLGQIDDPRVAKRLIQMVQENVYRQEALVALFSSPRREASQFLAFARHDPLLMASVHAAHYRFFNLP
jgi:HEAT repeat protein